MILINSLETQILGNVPPNPIASPDSIALGFESKIVQQPRIRFRVHFWRFGRMKELLSKAVVCN